MTRREQDIWRRFEISPTVYDDMLEKQHGKCAICHEPPTTRNLAVDHNHETGEVRSLLCSACNTALGLLKEDPARIRALLNYVQDPFSGSA